ncbi:MAG: hypothetical protein E6230_28045, partial [Paenibacillus dendritiformis]|nr:hypothetical protein [Paenibacillus dendritiformis]
ISTAGWACPGKWCSFQDGGNIHFPTQNFFLNSLVYAGISPNNVSNHEKSCAFAGFLCHISLTLLGPSPSLTSQCSLLPFLPFELPHLTL